MPRRRSNPTAGRLQNPGKVGIGPGRDISHITLRPTARVESVDDVHRTLNGFPGPNRPKLKIVNSIACASFTHWGFHANSSCCHNYSLSHGRWHCRWMVQTVGVRRDLTWWRDLLPVRQRPHRNTPPHRRYDSDIDLGRYFTAAHLAQL